MTLKFPKPTKRIKRKKHIRKISDKSLTIKLDNLVRDIFKQKYEPICYVCGANTGWFSNNNPYGVQVGHFIARGVFILRWDFMNLYPQCATCNSRHNDNTNPFHDAIIRREGQARMDYLDEKYEEHLHGRSLKKQVDKRELYDKLKLLLDIDKGGMLE